MNDELKYVVIIPVKSCSNSESVYDMCEWTKEHNIRCIWRTRHTEGNFGRAVLVDFAFIFASENDAMAFKLRWL